LRASGFVQIIKIERWSQHAICFQNLGAAHPNGQVWFGFEKRPNRFLYNAAWIGPTLETINKLDLRLTNLPQFQSPLRFRAMAGGGIWNQFWIFPHKFR
jgi:hypothetical protein